MKKITLKISGMSCEHCENRLKNTLLSYKGIHSCEANSKSGNVICDYDESLISVEEISNAILDLGFEVV